MNTSLRIVGALLALGLLCVGNETIAARSDVAPNADSIHVIITQLGDEKYSVRNRAEQELYELGAAAFDQLLAATNHPDLEIASRASYLLPRLGIQWEREDDSSDVRELMHSYGELSQLEREEQIQKLVALDESRGLAALCRIAHYDAKPTTARTAAVAVLESINLPDDRLAWGVSVVEQETSGSLRAPVHWIRLHFGLQVTKTDESYDWLGLIDQEIALLKREIGSTNNELVFRLLKYHLGVCQKSTGRESTFQPLRRMIDLYVNRGGELQTGLIFAFSWSTNNKQWDSVQQLQDHYPDQLREDRLLLYMVAEAADRQGESERAKKIAERAYQLEVGEISQRYQVADSLAELGRHDWAEREWQYVLDHRPADEVVSIFARCNLASTCFFDRGEYQKAADIVGVALEVVDQQLQKEKEMKEENKKKEKEGEEKEEVEEKYSKSFLQWLDFSRSLHHYFLACREEEQGNYQKQRELLERSYREDSENPDVLIAMYRYQQADDAYRQTTLTRIKRLSKKLEADIEAGSEVLKHCNHWAWLISNTEGDFKKAVAYSHRSLDMVIDDPRGTLDKSYLEMESLDLLPASAGYLDTLGRCYFAAGDLENAIKYQRQAVDSHPHLLVLRRQLKLFERELAAQNTK